MADGDETAAAAADELYGLAPDAFTSRRAELTKAARAAGDKAAATGIGAMRKPTVPAWLVNLLVREAADDLAGLLALGEQLREAQAQLQGPRIKELSGQASAAVQRLSRRAAELAAGRGQAVTAAVDRDVEQTLRAALADPRAERAVASGRLTRALAYAGFGEVDVSAATATPLAPAAPGAAARPGAGFPAAAGERPDEGPVAGPAAAEAPAEPAPSRRQALGEGRDSVGRPARGRPGERAEAAAARAEREAAARAARESAARAELEATAQGRRDAARAEEAAARAEHERATRDAEAAARTARDAQALVEELQERLAQARRDAAEAERAAGTARRAEVRAARAARAAAAALRAATARSGG